MARREVTEDDVPQTKFRKLAEVFKTIGDQYVGLYQREEENPNGYGQDYYFKERDGQVYKLTLKGSVVKQLQKAQPQPGEKVTITFVGERETEHINPQRLFKVVVDDAPKKAAAKPPPPVEDDDLPF